MITRPPGPEVTKQPFVTSICCAFNITFKGQPLVGRKVTIFKFLKLDLYSENLKSNILEDHTRLSTVTSEEFISTQVRLLFPAWNANDY